MCNSCLYVVHRDDCVYSILTFCFLSFLLYCIISCHLPWSKGIHTYIHIVSFLGTKYEGL